MDADTDDEAEVLFRAKLQRQDATNPWGFRLQGGADFEKPLTLLKVVDGSIASKAGLQPGDIVFKLAGCPAISMTHKDAQEAIRQSANSLEIIVGRSEEKAIPSQSSAVNATKNEKREKEPESQAAETNNHTVEKQPVPIEEKVEGAANPKSIPVDVHNSIPPGNKNSSTSANQNSTSTENQNSAPATTQNSAPVVNHSATILTSDVQQPKEVPVSNSITKPIPVEQPNTSPALVEVEVAPPVPPLPKSMDVAPPVPPLPPTVEVTPPTEPAVTKPKSRRQRRTVPTDIPLGDIPPKQVNGSPVEENDSSNVATVEMVIPRVQRPSTDSSGLLVSEEKLLTTADRRSGSSSPRNPSSPRLPSSPKLPSSPRASPQIPWQPFRIEDRKFTHIPVFHERSNSDNGIPLLPAGNVPFHIQQEASRVYNDASHLQHLPIAGQYSMMDLYPWRRPRSSSVDNSAGVTRSHHIPVFLAPNGKDIKISTSEREVAPPLELMKMEPVKPSLKLVGRRIESGMSSGSSDDSGYASAYPTISELPETQQSSTRTDFNTMTPEDIYFSAASPDLVDIPMPAVKEMVADLNRRLEAIAAQHPKLAEMSAPEFGISYEKKANEAGKDSSSSSSEEELKEIFINSPPSDLDIIRAQMLGLDNYEAIKRFYDSQRLSPSKNDDFSSALKQSRRVHFADPPEQSVIEIEPRHRRHRRRPHSAEHTLDLSSVPSSSSSSYSSPLSSEPSYSSPYLLSQSYGASSQPTYSGSLISQPIFSASQPTYASTTASQPVPGLYSLQSQPATSSADQYSSYQPQQRMSTPTSQGLVNISITHKQGEQSGKQYQFTMPPAQPGQPTRFHYTLSGKQPVDPFALSYSIPPSYEESMRNRGINTSQFRSRDDTFLPSPRMMSPMVSPMVSPMPYQRSPTPDSYHLQHIRSYSPAASPTRMMASPTGRGSPQAIQSKSFKVLEATLADQPDSEGNGLETGRPSPMRVEVLGHPREGNEVLHPVAISRPFVPSSSPPVPDSPEPTPYYSMSTPPPADPGLGNRPASQMASFPIPPTHPLAALGLPPGVIALFDRDFTEKFLQWQNQRSHFESETYKLVREMDNNKKFGNQ